jgi:hypothetical protein
VKVLLKPPDFGKDLKAKPGTVTAQKGGGFSFSKNTEMFSTTLAYYLERRIQQYI